MVSNSRPSAPDGMLSTIPRVSPARPGICCAKSDLPTRGKLKCAKSGLTTQVRFCGCPREAKGPASERRSHAANDWNAVCFLHGFSIHVAPDPVAVASQIRVTLPTGATVLGATPFSCMSSRDLRLRSFAKSPLPLLAVPHPLSGPLWVMAVKRLSNEVQTTREDLEQMRNTARGDKLHELHVLLHAGNETRSQILQPRAQRRTQV